MSTPAEEGFTPDRTELHPVICHALIPTEGGPDVECGWGGIEVVAIYDDTREALWWCPAGHENGWRI